MLNEKPKTKIINLIVNKRTKELVKYKKNHNGLSTTATFFNKRDFRKHIQWNYYNTGSNGIKYLPFHTDV